MDGIFDVVIDGIEMIFLFGGFGWVFYNVFGGIGVFGGDFILINLFVSVVYDVDFNGVLSGNNFLVFSGIWVIKGVVYEDVGNVFNLICFFILDFLIVNFGGMIVILELVDNGDGFVMVIVEGGMLLYIYMWLDG